jgi:VanZ family protein
MQNNKIKKVLKSVPAAILLLALYMMIFGFSAQDGEESGSLSQLVTEKCVEFFNAVTGRNWSQMMMESMVEYFEHPVRKLAHFSEYACMGILVYLVWCNWLKRGRFLYLLTVIWVFLSAAADEFHQYFVPGRYASVWDVLLDTCGGAFGLLVCIFFTRFIQKKRRIKSA